ncbi:fibrillin-1-like isoform X2 [Sycon ciliatum]|uniref:fibrillin-1-like isoform X2 n=1 Tax=Sycon ciliatum TaxID=27933 RepID=UPI0031F66F97
MSSQTYQLKVVVPPTILSLNTSHYVDTSNTAHPISCKGQGYPEPTVTLMVNNVVMTGRDSNNCAAGICTKTRTASLDGSTFTPGQSISITCTVDINQPPFTCTAAYDPAVQAKCNAAAKTTSHTRTIPVGEPCPLLDSSPGYDFNATFSNVSGTILGISCRAGFTVDARTSSIDTITCQRNGMWTPLPTCTDVDECLTKCSDSSISQCNNTMGSFTCTCNMGYRFDGTNCIDVDECLTMCKGNGTNCTNTVGSYKCECQTGYNGTAPSCTDIDECNTMCDDSTSSQCNNTLGSYSCTCNPGYTADGTTCAGTSTLEEITLAPVLNQSATSTLAPTLNQSATSMLAPTLNQSATSTLNQSATSTLAPDLNQSATSTLNQSATSMLALALNQSATSTVALLSDGGADPTSSVPDIGETPAQSGSVMSTGSTTTFNSTLDIPNGKSSLTGGQVAGLVIGTLLLVALIGGIVFTLVKKQSPGFGKHISMTEMNA